MVTVGEAWPGDNARWASIADELHGFHFAGTEPDAAEIRDAVANSLAAAVLQNVRPQPDRPPRCGDGGWGRYGGDRCAGPRRYGDALLSTAVELLAPDVGPVRRKLQDLDVGTLGTHRTRPRWLPVPILVGQHSSFASTSSITGCRCRRNGGATAPKNNALMPARPCFSTALRLRRERNEFDGDVDGPRPRRC